MNEVLKYLVGAVVGALIVLFFYRGCNKPIEKIVEKKVEILVPGKPVIVKETVPVIKHVPGKEKIITVENLVFREGRVDTVYKEANVDNVVNDYFVIRNYETKFPLMVDTVNYGEITTTSQVSENKLNLHNAFATLNIKEREVIKTVEKKSWKILLGFEGFGNKNTTGAGANIGLKTKKDWVFDAGVLRTDQTFFKGGFKIPLN